MSRALILLILALTVSLPSAAAGGQDTFLVDINLTGSWQGQVESLAPPRAGERFEFIPLQSVRFDHDGDELDERAMRILDDAALLIRHLPGVTRILIKGHTDDVGGEDYNDALSDRRAAAVHDYLVGHGISMHLLQVTGYGFHQPVDEQWTREGRARNRRVDVMVVRVEAP